MRTRSKRRLGQAKRRLRGREVPDDRAQAGCGDRLQRGAERADARRVAGVGRLVGAGEVAHDADDLARRPARSAAAAAATSAVRSTAGAPSRAMPVSTWRCTRARAPLMPAAIATARRCALEAIATSIRRRSADSHAASTGSSQQSSGAGDARPAERDGLVERRGADPGRAGRRAARAAVDRARTEAVGLDHGHHGGAARPRRRRARWRRSPPCRRAAAAGWRAGRAAPPR